MKLENILLLSAGLVVSVSADTKYFYNHVGYDAGEPVTLIVQSDADLSGAKWTLWMTKDSQMTGASVLQGELGKGVNPDNWLNNGKFYTVDLGQKLEPGIYSLEVAGASPSGSGNFTIAEKALATNTLGTVLDYFYNDRADKDPIVGWDKDLSVYGSGEKRDVHGGWYDASGDVSKYFSHLSYANYLNPQQIPLTVWALAFASERIPALLSSTTSKVKTADEAAYGADFLVRMQNEEGFFYMTVFDQWGSPYGKREICAFSGSDGVKSADYKTAYREGGGMAIAALARAAMLKLKGDYTSEQYLAAAKKGFEHLEGKQSIGGNCAYCDDGKENIIDDYTALLAATELYSATGEEDYLSAARKRAESLENRLSEEGYFWSDDAKTRPFWHASDAGLPLIALARYAEIEADQEPDTFPLCMGCSASNSKLSSVRNAIQKHLEWLVSVTNEIENPFGYARQTYKTKGNIKNGFFIPHDNESKYWWQGENARIASLASAAAYAFRVLGEVSEVDADKYATDQLDWILGKNPYDVCMMKGKGRNNPALYDGQSDYDATLDGGIANGISGKNEDGSGIVWDNVVEAGFSEKEPWNNWRWVEQWLPHSTWYLMALVSRYDEVSKVAAQPKSGLPKVAAAASQFKVSLVGRTLTLNLGGRHLQKNAEVRVVGLDGSVVASRELVGMQMSLELPQHAKGVYLVHVPGVGMQKVVAR